MIYVGEGRHCLGPDCKKKAATTTRWGGHKGGWDKQTGMCANCFEVAHQGRLFADGQDTPEDVEMPGLGVGSRGEYRPATLYDLTPAACPECGFEFIAFYPKKGRNLARCENGHEWPCKLAERIPRG